MRAAWLRSMAGGGARLTEDAGDAHPESSFTLLSKQAKHTKKKGVGLGGVEISVSLFSCSSREAPAAKEEGRKRGDKTRPSGHSA